QNIEDVVAQVIMDLYRPKNERSHQKLTQIFLKGEDAYFTNWNDTAEEYRKLGNRGPYGEFKLDRLSGDSPGPASYLTDPIFLNSNGRLEYKKALMPLLNELQSIEGDFNDGGRIKALKRSM